MSESRAAFLKSRLLVAALSVSALALPASASLGGDVASIQADQLHLQGTRTTRAAESYAVHEIQSANGTIVREYLSPEGKVFAVTWSGRRMPDLRQLFGNYFEQYRGAVQSRTGPRMARRPVMINEAGLVVQIGGHVGAFAGKACVPEMLPPGVRVEDIQ